MGRCCSAAGFCVLLLLAACGQSTPDPPATPSATAAPCTDIQVAAEWAGFVTACQDTTGLLRITNRSKAVLRVTAPGGWVRVTAPPAATLAEMARAKLVPVNDGFAAGQRLLPAGSSAEIRGTSTVDLDHDLPTTGAAYASDRLAEFAQSRLRTPGEDTRAALLACATEVGHLWAGPGGPRAQLDVVLVDAIQAQWKCQAFVRHLEQKAAAPAPRPTLADELRGVVKRTPSTLFEDGLAMLRAIRIAVPGRF